MSHEMHVVQQFNMVKTYPEKTLLYHFHAEKALFKGPKSAIWIFSENSSILVGPSVPKDGDNDENCCKNV